jgi:hypothetical protein
MGPVISKVLKIVFNTLKNWVTTDLSVLSFRD